MKKINFLPLSVLMMCLFLFSCSSDDEKELETLIGFNDLPIISQTFLNQYFGGADNVAKVEKDEEQQITLYEVDTKDGYELVFNSSGYWQEIDAPSGKTINPEILPEPIVATLNNQYHGYGVIEINTTGENYHLELSNNQGGGSIELIFNQSGEILWSSMN